MSQFEKIAKITGKSLPTFFGRLWRAFSAVKPSFVKKYKSPHQIHVENSVSEGWDVKRTFSFEKDGCLWVGEEFENGSSWRGTECLDYSFREWPDFIPTLKKQLSLS